MSRHDCARNQSSKALPRLPADYEFDGFAYEQRALRAIHDAMLQQLGDHQGDKAAHTAGMLLDRLEHSWISVTLSTAIDCLKEAKESPDITITDILRELRDPSNYDEDY